MCKFQSLLKMTIQLIKLAFFQCSITDEPSLRQKMNYMQLLQAHISYISMQPTADSYMHMKRTAIRPRTMPGLVFLPHFCMSQVTKQGISTVHIISAASPLAHADAKYPTAPVVFPKAVLEPETSFARLKWWYNSGLN